MYTLKKINDYIYLLHSNSYGVLDYKGSLKEVVSYMVINLDFNIDEVEFALVELLKRDDDVANFGVYKTFIYSHKSWEKVA